MEASRPQEQRLEQIVALVNRSTITSIGSVLAGIIEVINNPRSNARDLVELIQLDPPLTAKVLSLANSAYYAPRKRIAELNQAVIFIGFEALKEIALRQKVCSLFSKGTAVNGFSRVALWKHSVAVAVCAKLIFRREFQERGENAYVAGLLHDIGIIVEDQLLHELFRKIILLADRESQSLGTCEQAVLGCDHADIGAAVAQSWNFPSETIAAIGAHHRPTSAGAMNSRITMTLHVADRACAKRRLGYSSHAGESKETYYRSLETLGLHGRAVELILDEVEKELGAMEQQGLI